MNDFGVKILTPRKKGDNSYRQVALQADYEQRKGWLRVNGNYPELQAETILAPHSSLPPLHEFPGPRTIADDHLTPDPLRQVLPDTKPTVMRKP
jgi:hypothetical protein